jgi:hypothetical protein
LGALEVIANILFGSKDFNIMGLYIIKMGELNYFFRTYPIKNAEGDNIRKMLCILDQNIIKYNKMICRRFELIVFKK